MSDQNVLTDILAGAAVLVSLATAFYSSSIESRVRKQSDLRAQFDAITANPIEAQLQILTAVVQSMARAGMVVDKAQRIEQLSAIQTGEHKIWYFNMLGCLEAIDANGSAHVAAFLDAYWDKMADAINKLGEVDAGQDHNIAVKEVSRVGQEFLSKARRDIQSFRAKL